MIYLALRRNAPGIVVSLIASRLFDGRQDEWSEYSIPGQKKKFAEEGLAEKDGNWYLVPGKVDDEDAGLDVDGRRRAVAHVVALRVRGGLQRPDDAPDGVAEPLDLELDLVLSGIDVVLGR